MKFEEFEAEIRERETSEGVGDISKIQDIAEKVELVDLLHVLTHEILFSEQPKVLPLDEEGNRLRVAILQRPGLRGRYYLELSDRELRFFRWGYKEPLATYADGAEIKPVRDLLKKRFDI